jgi:hypothetical protein
MVMRLAELVACASVVSLLAPCCARAEDRVGEPPKFEEYPVAVYKGKVALPVFRKSKPLELPRPDGDPRCVGADEEQRRLFFRNKKPNFAGEWTIDNCTCGTGCGYPFMWNAQTGEVYRDFPFAEVNVGLPSTGWRGLVHTAGSRLLLAEGDIDGQLWGTCYYLWDGHKFAFLQRVPFRSRGPSGRR